MPKAPEAGMMESRLNLSDSVVVGEDACSMPLSTGTV